MREVMRAMPNIKNNKCHVCGKTVPANHQAYTLFDYRLRDDPRTKADRLYILRAHPGCAKWAGLLTHRDSPISDRDVLRFWLMVMDAKLKNGVTDFVC